MSDEVAVQIVTTVAEKTAAVELARRLLETRLAACVQIDGPLESHYRWRESLEQAVEWRLTIKTTTAATQRTIAVLREHHPYEEPEILVIPVTAGSESYLRWLDGEVDPSRDR